MQIAIMKERHPGERRIAMVPSFVEKLTKRGLSVSIEAGIGESINYTDEQYAAVGAQVVADKQKLLSLADLVIRLRKPTSDDVLLMKRGSIHISYLDPFNELALIDAFARAEVSSISMEMIPRTTVAQKMDALSSQASLAGYVAVILAAEKFDRIFPMMMTPAGTLSPARVFVIGAGVAGLQAIATAKRLGARVEAFDTRPVVEEEVKSLGGKFIKIDLGEVGQDQNGYAQALTSEQLELQQKGIADVCAHSDIVITTAQLFGRKAPRIVTHEMVSMMRPGSIIVDMAVESGGNVEGSEVDKEVEINGVNIIGYSNLPGRVPVHASEVFSSNIYNLIDTLWDVKKQNLVIESDDDILRGCLITHSGRVVNELIHTILNK